MSDDAENDFENSLLNGYGNPDTDENMSAFDRECAGAREFLAGAEPFWIKVAEYENEVNQNLLALMASWESADECDPDSGGPEVSRYREKVVRHIRFAAKLEAISGKHLGFYFISRYARYVYPRLLEVVRRNPVAQRYALQ